jgi:hypothetical protein
MQYGSLREKIATEKIERAERYERFERIVNEAFLAGEAAGIAAAPTPMTVVEADPITGRKLDGGKSYYVADGVCGFAWVKLYGLGNSSFGKYLAKNGIAKKSYSGGLQIWISAFNQSLDRKEACARAMAEVFNKYGFSAYAESRMD